MVDGRRDATVDVEVVDALAAQLPSRLTTDLLGFPEDRWRDVKSWSERLMRIDGATADNDAAIGMITAIQEFAQVVDATADRAAGLPGRRPRSRAGSTPTSTRCTMVHETGLFISGGAETTRTAIARGLRVLADHPDQWEAAAADPALVPGLVEEVIRWVTPLNNFFRTAATDTDDRRAADRRRATGSASSTRRRTATSWSSTTRSASTSGATRTATSRSATARTSASA